MKRRPEDMLHILVQSQNRNSYIVYGPERSRLWSKTINLRPLRVFSKAAETLQRRENSPTSGSNLSILWKETKV